MDATNHVTFGAMFRRERPPEQLAGFACSVEASGLDEVWIVEDCFWSGGLTAVSAALAATERITVGMGIVPAVARNAAITAMEMAGVARMFPGRFVAGVGHGVTSWMDQIGARPPSQLAALGETIDAIRRLLDGERLTVHGRYVRLDDVQLVFPPDPRPPIVVGVTGPKGIDVTARMADGLLLPEGSSPAYVSAATTRLGRRALCPVYVLFAVDDDADAARARVAPGVDVFAPGDTDERLAKLGTVERVAHGDRVDRYAVAGRPADCARAIDALVEAGATGVVVVPWVDDPELQDQQIHRFAHEVVPLVTRSGR
jgi:alkanesulfonate monooxygenase SsuD/methylene tetrahydromethanopterin reductase-like flavin-dependent oxidoreductase (luciferase family)